MGKPSQRLHSYTHLKRQYRWWALQAEETLAVLREERKDDDFLIGELSDTNQWVFGTKPTTN
jgi:hypothetical protein